ncbi:MAG: heparinase [Chitinophagaceae bacterium]|nr:heparinase [Chitinophagaceae bacterium]
MNKLTQLYQIWKNMGTRYLVFRAKYEWRRRTGKLKKTFPVHADTLRFASLDDWRTSSTTHFFFEGRDAVLLPREITPALKERADRVLAGEILFFSHQWKKVKDWHTHPVSGYVYDKTLHWSAIADIDPVAGDIKYVWEKARFSFVLDVVRYDYHSGENHGEWIVTQILSWIQDNPLNQGPHYRCSQETSLRIMNWMFALHFYKYSNCLTEERWQLIHNAIYRQLEHVFDNIEFSRIAVRNNHAISECLALYLGGLLFPFYPASKKWKVLGKRWLQEEITYQVYTDGTYLQFSMNYHRVALQLMSWAIRLSELNKEELSEGVYSRARKSLHFLHACQEQTTGQLPNYGNNDGAWFFPLSDTAFRDYRPLLNTASLILDKKNLYPQSGSWLEDAAWYGFDVRRRERATAATIEKNTTELFKRGGYFVHQDALSLTMMRCGAYKDRPGQADNMHLDIWIKGENILRDAGSYLYNTDEQTIRYFAGTRGHNTVMLGDHDQMLKGPRFIWWYWTKWKEADFKEDEEKIIWKGTIPVFMQLGGNIQHVRKVTKWKKELAWEIEDELINKPSALPMIQRWHPSEVAHASLIWTCKDLDGNVVSATSEEGWYSSFYGTKEKIKDIAFTTVGNKLFTRIEWKA